MKATMIMLKSIDDVKVFVNEVNKLSCDVDLSSGRYVVDAKSIMGIFSLDLVNPIKLDVHCIDENECTKFMAGIQKFIVK